MRTKFVFASLFVAMLLLGACEAGQPKIQTVEVTRLAPQVVTVDIPKEVPVTRVVTAAVTRIARKTQLVTVQVPVVVRETQIITVEVTRLVPQPQATGVPAPTGDGISYTFDQGIALLFPRSMHTATRLLDGRVLVVGGSQAPDQHLAEVEIYNPANGSLMQVASLHTARHDHSATLLLDGRVLVVGGYNLHQGWLSDAEIYDPAADTWTVIPPLYAHGVQHSATRLRDGRVLVAGGCIGSGACTERVEIFDPQTDSWAEAASFPSDRASHSATLLEDGRVLAAGGGGAGGIPLGGDALLYDPQNNTWTPTGLMVWPRAMHTAVRLLDGRVLVAGGLPLDQIATSGPERTFLAHVEIYNPDTNTWTATGNLAQGRYAHVMLLLQDGRVLVAGGASAWDCCWNASSFVREVEVYDPITGQWSGVPALKIGAYAAAVVLADGRAWLTGGQIGQTSEDFNLETWLITVK